MPTTLSPTDHYVQINGLSLHYVDWGGDSNRNLLLVHGQGGTAHSWDFVARELSGEFRVLAIDQRGHGDSDHTREGYALTAFASDLAGLAREVGIVPYDYCGAPGGAQRHRICRGDHSDHLKHLVCLDYGPEMSAVSAQNQIGGMNRRALGWRSIDEFVKQASEQNPLASEEYLRELRQFLVD